MVNRCRKARHLADIARWAIRVEYDGSGFIGWQKQTEGLSVQSVIEAAAARIVGDRPVASVTAGRTDTGVHAAGIVVHLDFPADARLDIRQIRDGMSYFLKPHRVVVLEAAPVDLEWSARFSAVWRRYRYTIINRASRPVLQINQAWHVKRPIDIEVMQRGADHLLGRHDFTSFRATACQAKSPVRTLELLSIRREGELVIIDTQARSFLHHQVRNMVGSLALVGTKQWHHERMAEALAARDRRAAGPTAPPDGLCLMEVGYQEDPFRKE